MWETENSMDSCPIFVISQGDNARPSIPQEHYARTPKCIRDPVHDNITIHPLLITIIDTPEFQRLRSVAQLGVVPLIFPGAVHTRFEHSVGTSHLAWKMVTHLKMMHPEFDITEEDVLCVSIAGLCHDLGHGPYSHLFEVYVNEMRENLGLPHWHHESSSILIVRHLLEANHIPLSEYNLNEEDVNFICLLIQGLKPTLSWPTNLGRPETKRFLFDIVSNKRNGIDVDKLDYFLRDSLHCYGRLPVDINIERIIQSSRAMLSDDSGQYQVCYEEKVALSLQDVFRLRAQLHKYVYQHRVVLIVQRMVLDVFIAVGDKLSIRGRKLYEVMDDISVYATVGDWILNYIASTDTPELQRARALLHRIHTRDLYTIVTHCVIKNKRVLTEETFKRYVPPEVLQANSFFITYAYISYASEKSDSGVDEDPLNHVRFFNPKEKILVARAMKMGKLGGLFTPSTLTEITAFICVRDARHADAVMQAFQTWKENKKAEDFVVTRGNVNSPSVSISKKRNRLTSEDPATQLTPM
eukprot:PhF_6_TR38328/c0_g1_i1/m.57150